MTIPTSTVLDCLTDVKARVTLDPTHATDHIQALIDTLNRRFEADIEGCRVESTDRFCTNCGRPLFDDEGPWCWYCEEGDYR